MNLTELLMHTWWLPLAIVAGIGLMPVGAWVWRHVDCNYIHGRLRIYFYWWRIRIRIY